MKIPFTALIVIATGIAVAEEEPKLADHDPFSNENRTALERHTGPPFAAKLPTVALSEAFKEPLLSDAEYKEREIYRFTIFPTFDNPMTFRLEIIDDSNGVINLKRLSGKGGYDLGTVDFSSSVPVEGRGFEELLKKVREPRSDNPYGKLTREHVEFLWGLDGSNWYLESRRQKDYSFTHVWCARSLPGAKKMLTEGGSKVYRQLDPEPFLSACVAIAEAAGFQLGLHSDALGPLKREQAGAGQPATRPESESEGGDKPQPESEGRSR